MYFGYLNEILLKVFDRAFHYDNFLNLLYSYFRPLTMGEIGCFLSHYNIWVEVSIFTEPKILFQYPIYDISSCEEV